MAKDAITMFKEAAAQLQREEAYLALEGTRKKNDEDEALQQLIGDFNLARIDLNSELSKSADKDQDKVNELNVKVNQLYNDIMANESMAAYNEAKAELESVMNYVNAIINTAVNGGDPLTVMDQVRDVKNTDEQWLESIALRQAMQDLSERERRILALRFYDGRTQMEVAGNLGISQAQVSRLEKGALASIRKAIHVS